MRSTIFVVLISLSFNALADKFSPAVPISSPLLDGAANITRIALGSCFHPSLKPEIFDQIAAAKPDVFVFLGDNVYAADESKDPNLTSLRQAYADLAKLKSFAALRQTVPVLPIWDDHDYGLDDAGGDWHGRSLSESLFEYVWAIDKNDARANRDGVYFERTVGPDNHKVQFILLDTRFFRTPLTRLPDPENKPEGKFIQKRYQPSEDPEQSVLGEAQWSWFATQLKKPADFRVIISTIQLVAEKPTREGWRMMPKERQRFYDLLDSSEARNFVVVSGDLHTATLYKHEGKTQYPIFELTTSSLNLPVTNFVKNPQIEPEENRIGDPYFESNYGLIDIDWAARKASLKIMDEHGELVAEQVVTLGNTE